MSAAQVVTCRFCGTRVHLDDGRYLCRYCRAEVRLDDQGEEKWHQVDRATRALEEVACGAH